MIDRRASLETVTAAYATEIDRHEPTASIAWPLWPDAARLTDHLGGNHLWAAQIVRAGVRVDRATIPAAPTTGLRAWYEECRADLLAALDDTAPDRECWTIGPHLGIPSFWTRRMLFETTKHLIDLRAAGGAAWSPADELTPEHYADGIDELLEVFLARSAPTLEPLPAPLALRALDTDRAWTLSPTWEVSPGIGSGATTLSGMAAHLALALWERADPLDDSGRFTIDGDRDVVAAFARAPIHP